MKKKIIGLIPCRLNSSRLHQKALLKIDKLPLIIHTLKRVQLCKNLSDVIVCTDSIKIKKLVESYGLKTPFLRPKKYSRDLSRDIEFVNHAINEFSKNRIFFKYCLILRPTSPIRSIKNVQAAYKKFISVKKASSIRAVTFSKNNPYKSWVISKGLMKPILKSNIFEHYNAPRQILPKTLWQTGNFEFFKINFKKKLKSISGPNILPYYITGDEILDIDNLSDIKILKKKIFN